MTTRMKFILVITLLAVFLASMVLAGLDRNPILCTIIGVICLAVAGYLAMDISRDWS